MIPDWLLHINAYTMACIDIEDYPYRVDIQRHLSSDEHESFIVWFKENNIEWQIGYGAVWFKDEESIILFRLKFGI